jgi:nicotinamidase-related amidase
VGWELALAPAPGELVVRKDRCDTFAGNPDLADILAERGVEQIVVAGFQSEYCVEETSRGAQRTGVPVLLVRGGHGTYDGDEPAATISAAVEQRLAADGIRLVDPDVLRAP